MPLLSILTARNGCFLKLKSHVVFGCLNELVRMPAILDAVEGVLGPEILVWTSSMFSKKPASRDFVSWHQDIAYWGLEPPDIVTAWVALTDSSPDNGCMRVVPGTHKLDVVAHRDTYAVDNMLSRGQEVAVEVDEAKAVDIVLKPGEMSLHHTKIVHGSNAESVEPVAAGLCDPLYRALGAAGQGCGGQRDAGQGRGSLPALQV